MNKTFCTFMAVATLAIAATASAWNNISWSGANGPVTTLAAPNFAGTNAPPIPQCSATLAGSNNVIVSIGVGTPSGTNTGPTVGFIIQRSAGNTINFQTIGTNAPGNLQFNDTGIPIPTNYFYRVGAYN